MTAATDSPLADVFRLADAEAVSLWREGGSIRFRAAGPLSDELAAGLHEHRSEILEALTGCPGGRREPGLSESTWTALAESVLAELPQPLRDHERDRWLADLASLWSKGMSGRDSARAAYEALEQRIAGHRRASEVPAAAAGVEA